MGGNASKAADAPTVKVAGPVGSGLGDVELDGLDPFNWSRPPTDVPAAEAKADNDLVFLSVAHCKGKPTPVHLRRSDQEERERRARVQWRKRTSFIELDCGDDSFFVSNTYKTVGVADGVGGWADQGVDSSLFSNELMRYAKWYSEAHRDVLDPQRIMTNAFGRLLHDGNVKAGGSTALLASLVKDSNSRTGYTLDVANLGDSGAIVVRDGDVVHRFHEKSHAFNCPFQMSVLPPGMRGKAYSDTPMSALREKIAVEPNDIVILGTDGLFDNRFATQICADAAHLGQGAKASVLKSVPFIGPMLDALFSPDIHSTNKFVDPYRVVERVVQDAYKTSLLKTGVTPWVLALKDSGVEGADGGKVDDVTCVIARVVQRAEMQQTTMW